MAGIIGKKIGMTSVFDKEGKYLPCTMIHAEPSVVSQVKTIETDGYSALQLGFGDAKVKKTSKSKLNHYKKANSVPKIKSAEFSGFVKEFKAGDLVGLDIFNEGDCIKISGIGKGRGFQGVVKRHHFSGVGGETHGQHNRQRHPGSIGASSFPSKVVKGLRMAGRMGNKKVTIKNMKIIKIYSEDNILLVKGSVPGPINSYLYLNK